jgi:hypothetical protein
MVKTVFQILLFIEEIFHEVGGYSSLTRTIQMHLFANMGFLVSK